MVSSDRVPPSITLPLDRLIVECWPQYEEYQRRLNGIAPMQAMAVEVEAQGVKGAHGKDVTEVTEVAAGENSDDLKPSTATPGFSGSPQVTTQSTRAAATPSASNFTTVPLPSRRGLLTTDTRTLINRHNQSKRYVQSKRQTRASIVAMEETEQEDVTKRGPARVYTAITVEETKPDDQFYPYAVPLYTVLRQIVDKASSGAAISPRALMGARLIAFLAGSAMFIDPVYQTIRIHIDNAPCSATFPVLCVTEAGVPYLWAITALAFVGSYPFLFLLARYFIRLTMRSRKKWLMLKHIEAMTEYTKSAAYRLPFIDLRIPENMVALSKCVDVLLSIEVWKLLLLLLLFLLLLFLFLFRFLLLPRLLLLLLFLLLTLLQKTNHVNAEVTLNTLLGLFTFVDILFFVVFLLAFFNVVQLYFHVMLMLLATLLVSLAMLFGAIGYEVRANSTVDTLEKVVNGTMKSAASLLTLYNGQGMEPLEVEGIDTPVTVRRQQLQSIVKVSDAMAAHMRLKYTHSRLLGMVMDARLVRTLVGVAVTTGISLVISLL